MLPKLDLSLITSELRHLQKPSRFVHPFSSYPFKFWVPLQLSSIEHWIYGISESPPTLIMVETSLLGNYASFNGLEIIPNNWPGRTFDVEDHNLRWFTISPPNSCEFYSSRRSISIEESSEIFQSTKLKIVQRKLAEY